VRACTFFFNKRNHTRGVILHAERDKQTLEGGGEALSHTVGEDRVEVWRCGGGRGMVWRKGGGRVEEGWRKGGGRVEEGWRKAEDPLPYSRRGQGGLFFVSSCMFWITLFLFVKCPRGERRWRWILLVTFVIFRSIWYFVFIVVI
jgi:hypothetical protein